MILFNRPVSKDWTHQYNSFNHFYWGSSFNPMGTGVFFTRGLLKCLPFLNQWSNCHDTSWFFLNWWILQACWKKIISTLVIILCYLISFYEVSRCMVNEVILRVCCIHFQPLQIIYKWHLTTSGRLAVTTKPCKIQKRVIPWSSDVLLAIKVRGRKRPLPVLIGLNFFVFAICALLRNSTI